MLGAESLAFIDFCGRKGLEYDLRTDDWIWAIGYLGRPYFVLGENYRKMAPKPEKPKGH
jgi:hypothetical protein